ncbi:polyphosphate kinase 1 [Sphingobacteriales bacterium UPWRP_1]|nr:polyphosphate kinase 1 [Sphingobacteriales bacterium TSM_CSS]PSJ77479.1 polyphosphate kinase 1 [Sphingobacteriales bacterium UPWRP_1]
MSTKKKYINREISWLGFNDRVLQEAEDESMPLLERIKFLGIFSNNLDEFFRVRVATLKRITNVNKEARMNMGFSPKKTLEQIQEIVFKQQNKFERIYNEIKRSLAQKKIFIINEKKLTRKQGLEVKNYFHEKVRPALVPLMLDANTEFPHLKDGSVYLAVSLRKLDGTKRQRFSLIEIPTHKLSRFYVMEQAKGKTYIILLDDVIRYCLEDIFAIFGYDEYHAYTIKITKDAEIDIDTDVSKSFLELIDNSIKRRSFGQPVRFIYEEKMPDEHPEMFTYITSRLDIDADDNMLPAGRYHNFKDFMKFPRLGISDINSIELPPLPHPATNPKHSLFSLLDRQDIMLHFPYHSYHTVIDFLREAAIDPRVKYIKITLYRLARNSNVVEALINARKNGKEVTAVLELQARFDEEANIRWAKQMQENGIIVLHGLQDLKIHAKLCLVGRQLPDGSHREYAYISTGNFNEDTARIYADDSLFTAHTGIIKDIKQVFDVVELKTYVRQFQHLLVSPYFMQDQLCALIDQEITNARQSRPAYIFAKLNSLNDRAMIDKLYEAAEAGVKIKLIVRGICCLNPFLEQLHHNIEAISIVDKFLEHSRVLIFANGGNEKYYIASADWMERNLRHRIEVACPIYDPKIQQELRKIIDIQLSDNQKARYLNHPDNNVFVRNKQKPVNAQNAIYHYFKQELTY